MIDAFILCAALAVSFRMGWKFSAASQHVDRISAAFDRDDAVLDEAENGWMR